MKASGPIPRLSVIIASYNRADILRVTLQSMAGLEFDDLQVEWIVVDNNSGDHTREVVESFQHSLAIKYLFEPKPGKNCALNKALREVALGDIVVFTDDDVTPRPCWLINIVEVCARRPDVSIFGGKVSLKWPSEEASHIVEKDWLLEICFSKHELGEEEDYYAANSYPFGPNFWMRGKVLEGRFYDERFGPRPSNRLMGSETSLLMALRAAGFEMLYVPGSVVEHRISPEECVPAAVRRRAFRFGRSTVRWQVLDSKTVYAQHSMLRVLKQLFHLFLSFVWLVLGFLQPSRRARTRITAAALVSLGEDSELLRMMFEQRGAQNKLSGQVTNPALPQAVLKGRNLK